MLTRSKYKSTSPCETISRIKSILASLDMQAKVITFDKNGQYFSCRIVIDIGNMHLLNLGANGKGMTKDFSLASGYAELIERLANKAVFHNGLFYSTRYFHLVNGEGRNTLDFLYFPDEEEKCLSKKEIAELIKEFFPQSIGKTTRIAQKEKIIFSPFYSVKRKCLRLIPIELIRANMGTTGLCAGNTAEEAIVQGVNEIMERYVLQRIFIERFETPEIPISLFKGQDIYIKLKKLEETTGVRARIKDCSLGGRLPVIGLLLLNKSNGTFSFRLGADYSIITALERCYTETYQGKDAECSVFQDLDPLHVINADDYFNCRSNGRGHFPSWILEFDKGQWKFPNIDFTNYRDELKYSLSNLVKQGFDIFIRDNSYLGFPSFMVYIPGMSDLHPNFLKIDECLDSLKQRRNACPLTYNIRNLTANKREQLAEDIINGEKKLIHYVPWVGGRNNTIYSDMLLSMLYIGNKNYKLAYVTLSRLLNHVSRQSDAATTYYRCFLAILAQKFETGFEDIPLKELYSQDLIDEINTSIRSFEAVLSNMKIPQCFSCKNCVLTESCSYRDIIRLERKTQRLQKKFTPMDLGELIYG